MKKKSSVLSKLAKREVETCTTREAADALGIALRTAQLWVESGVLQAWKTAGGHRRISVDSVKALLEQRHPDAVEDKPNRLKILVVEDEGALRKLYEMTMATWDLPVKVMLAENGYHGLIRIGVDQPDLLVSDLKMAGIDGFRMIRTIRANRTLDGMAIVVVTGLEPGEIEENGGLPGDVTVLRKPVDFERLEKIARATYSELGKTAKAGAS